MFIRPKAAVPALLHAAAFAGLCLLPLPSRASTKQVPSKHAPQPRVSARVAGIARVDKTHTAPARATARPAARTAAAKSTHSAAPTKPLTARERRAAAAEAASRKRHPEPNRKPARAVAANDLPPADKATSARVHAWLQGSGKAGDPVKTAPPTKTRELPAGPSTLPATKPTAALPATSPQPKATSADFARAAQSRPAPPADAESTAKPAQLETGVSHPPDDDETAPRARPTAAPARATTDPKPTPKSRRPPAQSAPVEVDLKQVIPQPPQSLVVVAPNPAAPVNTAISVTPAAAARVLAASPVHSSLEVLEQANARPDILPVLYNNHGRLIMPPPMKGTREILLHQNQVADEDGLTRVDNDDDLEELRMHRALVALPSSDALAVDERLPSNRRYCRPWAAAFLTNISRAYYLRFHVPLQVNSAVRTVEFQQRLLRTNGNAAPAEGDTASPHLTGQAVDLAKHGMSNTQIAWMRGYLLPLVQQGKIDVEEEFQQACFHISIYKRYLPPAPANRNIASSKRPINSVLTTE